jgi:hypothetical protein
MTTLYSLEILLFAGITSIALLIVLNLLLPGKVECVQEKLEDHYIRSFVIGLIALGSSFAILLLLAYIINLPVFKIKIVSENMQYVNAGQMPMPGIFSLLLILLALGLTSISTIGLAALANSLGQRIGKTNLSINPNLIGATLLVLSGLTPFLGWFVFAPVALCIGFGSTVQVIFQRKATPKVIE